MQEKQCILIADDSPMNRAILTEILGDDYQFIEAENGLQAVEILRSGADVDLLLLDIVMPEMDGFGVLQAMNHNHWIGEVPVVMISAESDTRVVEHAYDLGATDYISRPFDMAVVRRRVINTLLLYAKQKRLMHLVAEQVYEREKANDLMISILSHIVEFRNGESGMHVLHIRTATELLLGALVKRTDRYSLNDTDINLIVTASALHDIGKINVPESILNKPGRLTREEFEIMKTHTTTGASILKGLEADQDEPLVRKAYEICRWHHERYDGRGYPDGLTGEEIPISAQVVSLADVYDALTSERCYKKAFDHDTAIQMILNGECGTFNPLLLECLNDVSEQLRVSHYVSSPGRTPYYDPELLSDELLQDDDSHSSTHHSRMHRLLDLERSRSEFFSARAGGLQFEYDVSSDVVQIKDWYAVPPQPGRLIPRAELAESGPLAPSDWQRVFDALKSATYTSPDITLTALLTRDGEGRWYKLHAHTLWSQDEKPQFIAAIGCFTDIHEHMLRHTAPFAKSGIAMTGIELAALMHSMSAIFDAVHVVDPERLVVMDLDDDGRLSPSQHPCHALRGKPASCENLISIRALHEKQRLSKIERIGDVFYLVNAQYIEVDGHPFVLELVSRTDAALQAGDILDKHPLFQKAYLDAVTDVYGRRFLEERLDGVSIQAAAMLDADNFKYINDSCGHPIGDVALRRIARVIRAHLDANDLVIRYGGDEFVILFPEITPEQFQQTLEKIREDISRTPIEAGSPHLLSVSIGGVYGVPNLTDAIRQADQLMYLAKQQKNQVQYRIIPGGREK